MLPAQPNRSLIDGMACLQALAVSGRPVGVRELVRQLNLEPTRVHRLLKTLAHLGFTRQTADRKYEPGPGMNVLFAQSLFASGLLRRASDPLLSLRGLDLEVALGVLWNDQVCYLYHAKPGMSFGEGLGRIGVYPATRSSIGMLLLSQMDEGQVRATFRGRQTPGFSSMNGLMAELKRVRANGFARVITCPNPLNATMAVPVGEPPEAALALSGAIPAARVPEVLKRLNEAATRIAAAPHGTSSPDAGSDSDAATRAANDIRQAARATRATHATQKTRATRRSR